MRTSKAYHSGRHGSKLTGAVFTGRMTHFGQYAAGITGKVNQAEKICKKTPQIFSVYRIITRFVSRW
jgi:hypothetical protein